MRARERALAKKNFLSSLTFFLQRPSNVPLTSLLGNCPTNGSGKGSSMFTSLTSLHFRRERYKVPRKGSFGKFSLPCCKKKSTERPLAKRGLSCERGPGGHMPATGKKGAPLSSLFFLFTLNFLEIQLAGAPGLRFLVCSTHVSGSSAPSPGHRSKPPPP
jgi:hypothetical protein